MDGNPAEPAGSPAGPRAVQGREGPSLHRPAPLRIAALYAAVGVAWLLFSDRLLEALVSRGELREHLRTAGAWFFVLATSALLLLLLGRLAAAIRHRDERLQAALDGMPDAVLVMDAAGRVIHVNQAAAELLGAANESELMVPLPTLARRFRLRRTDGSPVRPTLLRALAKETLRGWEAVLRRPDGRDVYVAITASPLSGRPGDPRGLTVAVIRDVSDLRRFEEMREDFLATAGHEFKTPLAVIKAQAQMLQRRAEADPHSLQVLNRQVERLSRLTHQLVELSRLRLGGPELRRETYDLGEQVAEVLARLQSLAAGHRLTLASREQAPVHADRERMEQVLVNLVDNAVKFSPGGCDVETTMARQGGEVRVSVRDMGVGIPRDKQARIFERYYRAHAGTAEDYGGIGVGLDMSREIVNRHGGRMWFESEPGVGSIFSFTLPLAEDGARG